MSLNNLFAFVLISLFAFSCSSEDETLRISDANFDRDSLLVDWMDYYILPELDTFSTSASQLRTATKAFADSPNTANLTALQSAHLSTWKNFQAVAFLEFGPTAVLWNESINIFPVDGSKIDSLIKLGTYDLESRIANDARGFPAMDYLLNSRQDDMARVAYFSGDSVARAYLLALAVQIETVAKKGLADWTTYRPTFVSRNGVDAGSSLSAVVNGYNIYLERRHRSARFRDPGGGTASVPKDPTAIESFYGGHSLDLAKACNTALVTFFNNVGDKQGLDDYLKALGTRTSSGEELHVAISNQFDLAGKAMDKCKQDDGTLAKAITNDSPNVKDIYSALQRLILYTKIDMSSAMGVRISYADNDGD